ncbi:preprotein translocase subunit SecG [Variovorax ginsengisoli]|jgi:preprotein translocase subunit SecG|uniref:Protein-export membrane protein SecG n=1 Tax=Variovorax ginsengisoli TaxID=363844 RepID=A0ABT8S455_9BURK|nr:preprotein translocase subunit SecG [Variovorax ginsengisoli]MDN8613874.1 preprotein translocase subunit SecG [Variovorax ginsengisoli]MDO1533044.1 preprotein translocase subunit SecG [Variovorax ginsengisoli]
MNVVLNILVGVQMLTALAMIGLILVQHGKGADMGAAFGSGSAGSLFGASGSANFLSRTTAVLAAVFFACTLLLAYFGHARPAGGGSLLERAAIGAPVAPAPAPAPVDSAAQIPAGSAAPAPAAPASAPAAPAPGAGQIPAK